MQRTTVADSRDEHSRGNLMKIVNRKTRKAIRKSVKKAVKKHGPKVVAGLAAGIASTLAALASTDAAGTRGRQSNLGKMSQRMSEMLLPSGKQSRKRGVSGKKLGKKRRGEERSESDERSEGPL
jgi:hypothetical protein